MPVGGGDPVVNDFGGGVIVQNNAIVEREHDNDIPIQQYVYNDPENSTKAARVSKNYKVNRTIFKLSRKIKNILICS